MASDGDGRGKHIKETTDSSKYYQKKVTFMSTYIYFDLSN